MPTANSHRMFVLLKRAHIYTHVYIHAHARVHTHVYTRPISPGIVLSMGGGRFPGIVSLKAVGVELWAGPLTHVSVRVIVRNIK